MIATTTLNKIREHEPCADGWGTLLKHLGKTKADNEVLTLKTILESNGLDDALWCLRASDASERDMRLFAVWCARQVEHLMEDKRSVEALNVAERHANGGATYEELAAARAAAMDAAWVAARAAARAAAMDAAWVAAWAAARGAARAAAMDAAWAAARGAATDAAWVAARAAAWAAARGAATDAAMDAATDAARAAAWAAQKQKFIEMFCEGVVIKTNESF